ncbi:hypothetical protein COHA_005077 [Chlorella ohadii]|uniref:NAD-dependent epimerase/dehydratase domain-containing protein n=1 Tax=Chlorella ohadii TaxID=2649997 RepID=A0AAD5DNT6_9CHLO|nr:hypothetical protein COHA_005077 [Chlorella ohadii]
MASKAGGSEQRVALVTGATGITGRHCVDALLRHEGWQVVTVTLRDLQGLSKEEAGRVTQIKADLSDRSAVEKALKEAGVASVGYIFHCAFLMRQEEPAEECKINLGMLRSVVEAAEALDGGSLRHVFTMEGGKWYGQGSLRHVFTMEGGKCYGQHLSTPLKTPHREDDPPIMGPMFYYE